MFNEFEKHNDDLLPTKQQEEIDEVQWDEKAPSDNQSILLLDENDLGCCESDNQGIDIPLDNKSNGNHKEIKKLDDDTILRDKQKNKNRTNLISNFLRSKIPDLISVSLIGIILIVILDYICSNQYGWKTNEIYLGLFDLFKYIITTGIGFIIGVKLTDEG